MGVAEQLHRPEADRGGQRLAEDRHEAGRGPGGDAHADALQRLHDQLAGDQLADQVVAQAGGGDQHDALQLGVEAADLLGAEAELLVDRREQLDQQGDVGTQVESGDRQHRGAGGEAGALGDHGLALVAQGVQFFEGAGQHGGLRIGRAGLQYAATRGVRLSRRRGFPRRLRPGCGRAAWLGRAPGRPAGSARRACAARSPRRTSGRR